MAKKKSKQLKLLVVDDEPDICTTVQRYFGKRGFIISTTGSGREALSMIKASAPDLVLLDITLNDLNGIDVLKNLREYDKETKVVIITGQMYPPEEVEQIVQLGVSGYEHKPLILEDLERLVNQVTGHKSVGPRLIETKRAPVKAEKDSSGVIRHKLKNFLGIIRNKCENFTLNLRDGIYDDKSQEELVKMSVEIMTDIMETVDKSTEVVEEIRDNKGSPNTQ